jgi:GMP synthase-like glutamine amidotransferase
MGDQRSVLLISHEPEASPGMIGAMLRERGVDVRTHVVLTDPANPSIGFPDPTQFDAVIAFGSFSNAYAEHSRPWVAAEIDYITRLMELSIPYLGVCFGGQLLSEALGGSVERAPEGRDEIGVVSIGDVSGMPIPSGPWFTWHEDRILLPDGVEVLARNDNAVQLFRQGNMVGTQFHPEADVELVSQWLRIGPDHVPERTSAAELLSDLTDQAEVLRRNCEQLVDWFFTDVAGAPV